MPFDIINFARSCSVAEPEKFAESCEVLRRHLETVNRSVNLTRITSPEEFAVKHAADSLLIARCFPEISSKKFRIADIGCGAGFPSLILALAFPQLEITSIDSTGKKINFVAQSAELLGLKNLTAIHGRAIELNRKADFQHKFDLVTARAVAPSPKLYRETEHFLNASGRWIFYKTPGQAAEELPELQKTEISWSCSQEFELPENAGSRVFVSGEKIR